ncbi:MAG: serine/threonine protein kinase [marine benthic group bacterium]|nr:serine/threonine protein kinase [Candidatus Carthagonibacter metallireducens]
MKGSIVAPHLTTPAAAGDLRALPAEILEQTCKRVGIASFAFAGIWAWVLLMNTVVWRLVEPDGGALLGQMSGRANLVAVVGIGLSLAMVFVAGALHHRPSLLIDIGLGFEVTNALLIAVFNWLIIPPEWYPSAGVSFICVVILFYPTIAPAGPYRTLAAAFLAASLDPLVFQISVAQGNVYDLRTYDLLWTFGPNYVCALLAVVPATVIRGLGKRVSRERELGAYRIGERIGHGGMGDVYRATHRLLARPAAIKLIRPEVLGSEGPDRARVVIERFRREARAAANLRSPHTIELYDFGTADDGTFYYVMELLDGLNLDRLVTRFGPLGADRTVNLLKQICLSLGEAHERGLVHRDIKPSNLVACKMGLAVDFMKVLDFGLVKASSDTRRDGPELTSPDVTTGTPTFMAPEIAVGGRPVDSRADIYALGCVAFWMLTGRNVFEGPTSIAILTQHVRDAPPAPSTLSETGIPPELDRIVLDCLAKDPDDRPESAIELFRRLDACPVQPWTAERARQWWELHIPESEVAELEATDRSIIGSEPTIALLREE